MSNVADMDDPKFEEYIECAAKCEAIALEIFPSYNTYYASVPEMMKVPPDVMTYKIAHKLSFMQHKLKTFEKLRSDLQSRESPSVGASAAGGATKDLTVEPVKEPVKEPSFKKFKSEPSSSRPKKTTTDTADRIMAMPLGQRLDAMDECMKAIDVLPLTIARYDGPRQKQRTYLAFAIWGNRRVEAITVEAISG